MPFLNGGFSLNKCVIGDVFSSIVVVIYICMYIPTISLLPYLDPLERIYLLVFK